jgi:hypothetical protein
MKPPSLARWFLIRTLTGAAPVGIIGDLDADRAGARHLVVRRQTGHSRGVSFKATSVRPAIRDEGGPALEIVGVVRDFRFASLHEEPPPAVFHPVAQQLLAPPRFTMPLRTSGDARALIAGLREQVRTLDPDVGLTDARTPALQFDRITGKSGRDGSCCATW